MCGISGRINLDGRPVLASELETLRWTLTHRGPGEGRYLYCAHQWGAEVVAWT